MIVYHGNVRLGVAIGQWFAVDGTDARTALYAVRLRQSCPRVNNGERRCRCTRGAHHALVPWTISCAAIAIADTTPAPTDSVILCHPLAG